MRQVLDRDAAQHATRYGNLLPPPRAPARGRGGRRSSFPRSSFSSSFSSASSVARSAADRPASPSGRASGSCASSSASSSVASRRFLDLTSPSDDRDSRRGDDRSTSVCGSMRGDRGTAAASRPRLYGSSAGCRCLLLGLILYGSVSMVADVATSVRSWQRGAERRPVAASSHERRFPGGFLSDGSPGAARSGDGGAAGAGGSARARPRAADVGSLMGGFRGSRDPLAVIDWDDPADADVPALTEHLLSTIFRHAADVGGPSQPHEIPLFWSIGGTPGRGPVGTFPGKIARSFPNVVQAGRGAGGAPSFGYAGVAGLSQEEARAPELHVLQDTVPLEGSGGAEGQGRRDGATYVNVDLYTEEGMRRAADLRLLFPTRPYPVVHEGGDGDGGGEEATPVAKQVQLVESPFLPEALGLFEPPPGWSDGGTSPHRARAFGLFLPTAGRIGLYWQHHKHLLGMSFLRFVASSSIVVNNYVTRVLSGQWDEGSPVTPAHLEVAKGVLARRVRLWPNQGAQDMVREMADRYGWDKGLADFRQGLVAAAGGGAAGEARVADVQLGSERMFPPPSPQEPPEATGDAEGALAAPEEVGETEATVAATEPPPKEKPPPSEVEVETSNIIKERNQLDNELFRYVMQAYWKARKTAA